MAQQTKIKQKAAAVAKLIKANITHKREHECFSIKSKEWPVV